MKKTFALRLVTANLCLGTQFAASWLCPQPKGSRSTSNIFVLMADTRERLKELHTLHAYYDDKKLLLILPDNERETYASGFRLYPGFVTLKADFEIYVYDVLEKMIEYHNRKCATAHFRFKTAAEKYKEAFDKWDSLYEKQQVHADDMDTNARKSIKGAKEFRADQKGEMQAAASSLKTIMLIGALLAILIGSVLAFFITRSITKPINTRPAHREAPGKRG